MERLFRLDKKKSYTFFLIFTLSLYSCSTLNNGKIAPGYFQAYELLRNLTTDSNEEISWSTIEEIPYASMILRVGNTQEALLILESRINDSNIWVSSDRIYIEESNGRVLKTSGFYNNLSNIFGNLTFIDGKEGTSEERVFYYSFSNPTLSDLEVLVKQTYVGEETVKMRSGERVLRRYEEDYFSPRIGWKGKNIYWVDGQKKVLKSLQSITPKIEKFSFEEARPYSAK